MSEATEKVGPGRTVGRYRLVRRLGIGGFGEVLLGEAEDGTRAAVKLLHATWSDDQNMRRRFAAEVERARSVGGSYVAEILDADPDADRPWIASEYIDGPTLQQAVTENGPRTGGDMRRLAVSSATALAAIHAAGVVHRDLKPDNIMLGSDGPRVIDFGIARAIEATSVTASGIVGTVGYMAPEQLEGTRIGTSVDVFSWAAVMVFAATGKDAFPGPSQAARIARVLGGKPDTGDLSGPLLEIILACLAKKPEDRPDARTLLRHLVEGTAPVRTTPVEQPPKDASALPGAHPAGTHSAGSWGVPEDQAGPERSIGGDVPPYHFAGTRFTNVADLAAAFQRHWPEALRIFADRAEFATLGSWVMEDLSDTEVDRALFRREIRDVNLALATFIAEANPALPPRFRDHDASVTGLSVLFHDPRPLGTGDPTDNELLLLARPEVLRVMARHEGEDSDRLRSLAEELARAERAGTHFLRELTEGLTGWGSIRSQIDPALTLVFLLHPTALVAPDPGSRPWAREWFRVLWSRVEASPGADRAGAGAAVHGSASTVVHLAAERHRWEGDLAAHRSASSGQGDRKAARMGMLWLVTLALTFSLVSCVSGAATGVGPAIALGVLSCVLFVLLLAGWVGMEFRSHSKDQNLEKQKSSMGQHYERGLRMMDQDLARARQICSGPAASR
ncbi:serine/threonine-protein kinase [Nocardiopsis sp. JB363]|uniref:serine/threonine-protein kinase n=1 Tax=Nocardiopsis sp. JB363 TaxID=1434837 RepID=UPI000979E04F|nr:serine/threonine-protein kinase [Nocardiopsis sp. JB363]SIO86192.1 Tyrosine protein kinase:Serine/threonine protein kinase [Nocardiopsis sp. JB363]